MEKTGRQRVTWEIISCFPVKTGLAEEMAFASNK
jgi:hypothetical protein